MKQLKYQGHIGALQVFAAEMAAFLPADTGMLVPIPRVLARRVRYGIDPALELARAVGRRAGVPVVSALRAPLFGPARAGRAREDRLVPAFKCVHPVEQAVIVDDVVTTGATLRFSASVLGSDRVLAGLTATAAP